MAQRRAVTPCASRRRSHANLRALDSLQLTAKHKVATPVNWKRGDDVIIAGSVSDDEAKKIYPGGWKAPKSYLRIVKQPHQRKRGAGHPKAARANDRAPARVLVYRTSIGTSPTPLLP